LPQQFKQDPRAGLKYSVKYGIGFQEVGSPETVSPILLDRLAT
jgi:hypothetical protein